MKGTIVFKKNWEAIHAVNSDGERKYRYIINEGSSRSSKTRSLIDCYDLYARANVNKRLTVWRDTKTDCRKTVLNDLMKHLKSSNRFGVDQRYNITESIFTYNTGSTLEIHGTDDEETVHGLEQDAAWLNEPYKISRDTFDQIDQRTSDFVFLDWNPKKEHWIEDLKKDPRTLVIHSTFKDNPFCPAEQRTKILSYQPVPKCYIVTENLLNEHDARAYDLVLNVNNYDEKKIKELLRCRENEAKNSSSDWKWCVYGLGVKGERPNRIFHWNEISNEMYKALNSTVYYAVDWGTVDNWGILEAKYYDGGLYLHELNYASENEIRSKMTVTEINQINAHDAGIADETQRTGIVKWLFSKLNINQSSTIVCDTNRPNKIAALRRVGYQAMPATKGAGSIIDGIDILNNITVYFTSSSINLKYEQENYSRKVDKFGVILEEPEDNNNHCMDPARYIAQHLLGLGIIKQF